MERELVTILCVDDEPNILAALKRILRDYFNVLTATNVEDGAQILKINPDIELVLSDHHMPGVSGIDFLTWCHTNYPHIVRIALTGYPDSDVMREALRSGLVRQIISKPWDDEQIINTIKTALRHTGDAS